MKDQAETDRCPRLRLPITGHRSRITATLLTFAFGANATPSWWTERGVLNEEAPAHHSPVNQGQLKWIALQAAAEFDEKLPGPENEAIRDAIEAFPAGNNFRPANLGMLKNAAKPFYDRLIGLGWVSDYPWAGKTPADYNLANQGQLKNLFAIDLNAIDLDQNGVPDWWTRLYGFEHTDENNNPISVRQAYENWLDAMNNAPPGENDLIGAGETEPTGEPTDTLVLHGAAAHGVLGTWIREGTAIRAVTRRGRVRYQATLQQADIYRVRVEVTQGALRANQSYDLRLAINGEFVSRQRVWLQNALPGHVQIETPYLPAGTHTLELYWDNPVNGLSLRIQTIRFQQWTGPDSNSNGIQDWVENRLIARNTIERAPLQSAVSPACVEGQGRFAIAIDGAAEIGPAGNDRWYANVSLPSDGSEALIGFRLENGGRTLSRRMRWKATDLLTDLVPVRTLRVGDALRLSATPHNAATGTATVTVNNNLHAELQVGETAPYTFTAPGEYTVTARFSGTDTDNNPLSASRTVIFTLVESQPEIVAAQVGQYRLWTRPENWHPHARIEWDNRLAFEIGEDGLQLKTDLPEERYGVVRLGVNGPVLSPVLVKGFNLWVMRNTDLFYEEIYPDGSFRAESTMIMSPVLTEVWTEQRCRGPVAYLDGSRVRVFEAQEFDSLGEIVIVFAHSSALAHSVCHYTDTFQGDVRIGRGY